MSAEKSRNDVDEVNFNVQMEETLYKPYEESAKMQMLKPVKKNEQSDSLFLYLTAFAVGLCLFAAGIGFSWTSPVLPKLHQPNNPLGYRITPLQESWIATSLAVGGVIGPLVIGNMADILGRKNSLIIWSSPMLFSYLILAYATNIYLYYLARFLHGFGVGGLMALVSMYIGEITEHHNRGKFNCMLGIFMSLGLLYPLIAGSLMSIQYFTLSCAVPVVIFLIWFGIFMPETPNYLVYKKKKIEAEKVLMKLRNRSQEDVDAELMELCDSIEKSSNEEAGLRELFGTPSLRRTVVITGMLLIFQQFSGIPAIMSYLESIFRSTGSEIPPELSAGIIGIIQVIMNIVITVIVDKFGRKVLLIASCAACAVSLLLLGLYYFLVSHHFEVSFLWWVPVTSLVIYIGLFNIGIGPIPWTIMSEIFPSNVRSVASAISAFLCSFSSVVVTLAFPLLSDAVGMAWSFWIFGGFCVLELIFVYFFVPETKGKSADEIQNIIKKHNINKKSSF